MNQEEAFWLFDKIINFVSIYTEENKKMELMDLECYVKQLIKKDIIDNHLRQI
jgi:hypothetical protein